MFTVFITYVEATFVQTNVLYHSPNLQLNRQPVTCTKRASKPEILGIVHLSLFKDLDAMFTAFI